MTRSGRAVGNTILSVGHVAGMIDMVALPLWVGGLIQHYGYGPARAGGAVTLFLFSVVVASALVAPRFERLPHRLCVAAGFAVASACFLVIGRLPVGPDGFAQVAALHALAGFSVGCALSITHGAIGRTENPHRLFGAANVLLGVLGVFTFAGMPSLIANFGPQAMFTAFGCALAVASLICAVGFPQTQAARASGVDRQARVPTSAWLVIFTVICMTFNQAMVFSFLAQLGSAHSFTEGGVNGVLVALGFVNLLPGALAAVLQKRLSPLAVGFAGPIAQATLALTLSFSTAFAPFALAGALYVSIVIFTHTFLFGLLSRLDASGRSVAATPAMMMIGSCTGPAVGGLIVSTLGYQSLGPMAAVVSLVALGLLTLLRQRLQGRAATLAPVHG